MTSKALILASASPRRRDLLKQIGVTPTRIEPANINERVLAGESPRIYAARVAGQKAALVSSTYPDCLVLAADTVVACGRRILPKAETEDEARACLALISGRSHRVYTGVALVGAESAADGQGLARLVETRVKVRRLGQAAIDAYIHSDEWRGKAGGYAIQGRFAEHIISVIGSYPNVVGLPLYETANLLRGAGYNW